MGPGVEERILTEYMEILHTTEIGLTKPFCTMEGQAFAKLYKKDLKEVFCG